MEHNQYDVYKCQYWPLKHAMPRKLYHIIDVNHIVVYVNTCMHALMMRI